MHTKFGKEAMEMFTRVLVQTVYDREARENVSYGFRSDIAWKMFARGLEQTYHDIECRENVSQGFIADRV